MTRIGRIPHNREFPTTMAAEAESLATTSIVLRAPEGEVGWMMVELQGTVEARNGSALDGMELGRLVREVCS